MEKKGYIKLLIICIFLLIVMGINSILKIFNSYTYPLFLILVFGASIYLIGFEKERSLHKRYLLLLICIITVIYILIIYLLGIYIGFSLNGHSLSLLSILKNIFFITLTIVMTELIRYNLVTKSERSKSLITLITTVFIIAEAGILSHGFAFEFKTEVVEFIFSYLLIIIFQNIFLTYLALKVGYKTAIVHLLILELPTYFMPLIPELGSYMDAVSKLLLLAILLFLTHMVVKTTEKGTRLMWKVNKLVWLVILLIAAFMIFLNCGLFKYYTLTIGSGSMHPTISVGDVIIVEKKNIDELPSIKVDDVLVFKNSNRVVVHRVISIEIKNNEYLFYTKGDANKTADDFIIRSKDVIGITKVKIPIIGKPSVWLKEQLN